MNDVIKQLSDENFEEHVVKATGPVLVDYWAEWCAPCKMMEPVLLELSGDYKGRLQIAKVNIDHAPDTTAQYNIRGIPTLMLFRDGKNLGAKVGAITKSELQSFVDELL